MCCVVIKPQAKAVGIWFRKVASFGALLHAAHKAAGRV
jgi:hypothetical protein